MLPWGKTIYSYSYTLWRFSAISIFWIIVGAQRENVPLMQTLWLCLVHLELLAASAPFLTCSFSCPALTSFPYFRRFQRFPSSGCKKARGISPRGCGSVCVCDSFKILWIQRSVSERKIARVWERDCVSPCVSLCVPPFLRLSNWGTASVCAVHQPFRCKSHMSIAVNLDNGIKLVGPLCAQTHCRLWVLLINTGRTRAHTLYAVVHTHAHYRSKDRTLYHLRQLITCYRSISEYPWGCTYTYTGALHRIATLSHVELSPRVNDWMCNTISTLLTHLGREKV